MRHSGNQQKIEDIFI